MEMQKGALGKGLASLLPGAAATATPATAVAPQASSAGAIPGVTFLSVSDIQVNHYQPRKSFEDQPLEELSQSIRTNGIIQPLVVRRTESGFQLIAGERRLRAAKLAGLKQVPVVVRRSTDKEALELALVENIQRQDLNCVDEALAYQQLMTEFQLTQEEVAHRVGKDRATVANFLRVLRLPREIQSELRAGVLSFGHAKALLALEDPAARLELCAKILAEKLSVRQAEALAHSAKQKGSPKAQGGAASGADPVAARFMTISQELTRAWSARVEVRGTRRRGKLIFQYESPEQLERLLGALQNPQSWLAKAPSPQA
jgi:ParB family transcriptional regulator, chromosome partitioning protein